MEIVWGQTGMAFLKNRSISTRLLVFVNIITLFAVAGVCALMVINVRNSVSDALRNKMESSVTFLQEVSPQYLMNYDIGSLERFTKIFSKDEDMVYAIFYDTAGKPITDTRQLVNDAPNIVKIERNLSDPDNKKIGTLRVAYKTDVIKKSYNRIVLIAIAAVLVVGFAITLGIWALFRNILAPVVNSLKKLLMMSQTLSTTSVDITKSSESLSAGVNQQAAVVQQTTSAMTEMSGMLSKSSSYSKQSEQVMESMTAKAKNGMEIMNEMVEAMGSVQQANAQLKQMAKIISEIASKTNVINDIVFKTQLLSFNASIEAARAGQHGRGFSVVAEEVGNLAKMSGTAAQEIAALLQDSEKQVQEIVQTTSERVNAGKGVAEQAMKNFKEIAHEISQTFSDISNISAATKEQEYGIIQTTEAMSELNKTAELNSIIARRSNDAALTLRRETEVLGSITRSIHHILLGARSFNAASKVRSEQSLKSKLNSETPAHPPSHPLGPLTADSVEMTHESLVEKVIDLAKKKQGALEAEQEKNGRAA